MPIRKSFINIVGALLLYLGVPMATFSQNPIQRIILIGDAGDLENGHQPVIDAMRRQNTLDKNTTVIFLGDNVYPQGLPPENDHNYPKAARILSYQTRIARETKARVILIPGNHDWAQGRTNGWDQVRNQERFVDSLHLPNLFFYPANGCPGPVEVSLDSNITLIIVDTQWFLHSYEKPSFENDCECKNEDEFLTTLGDMVSRNRNKIVLFATHHPFRTHGPHGGYFTWKQHLFPLTELSPPLYIPLPLIGSIYPLTRGVFGNIQDTRHPVYKKMVSSMESVLKEHPQVIFLAGHDHSLQWIQVNGINYIGSGAGAESSRVKKGANSVFARKGFGYATLTLLDNRELQLQFTGVSGTTATRLLDTSLLHLQIHPEPAFNLPALETPLFVNMAAGSEFDKASSTKRFFLGQNYRKEWGTKLDFRTFQMSHERGGMTILQRGGGHQTKSLRLEDSSGKQWVLRSIQKFPEAAIPVFLRRTFALELVKDQISASHPYGPLLVPVLADATGVPHTHPEIVFIADDTSLGKYRKDFANTLALFEEREPLSDKTFNTEEVLEEILTDNDNTVDQSEALRARLLDIYIGDWDRHDDQWRWVDEQKGKGKRFLPVPRDRDQAFFVNSGLIPGTVRVPWLLPFLQGYKPHLKNINGFNFQARYFDRSFLHELEEREWINITDEVLTDLSDEVIESAIQRFPQKIQELSGAKMKKTLLERRKYLKQEALTYYRFLANTVSIPGSDKRERFVLKGAGDGTLSVRVEKIDKDGNIDNQIYQRTFRRGETREIRLYGLKGDDQIRLEGKIPPIRTRWIGGAGNDTLFFTADAELGKNLFIYDYSPEQNNYPEISKRRLRLSNEVNVNDYERKDFNYNRTMPVFQLGFNQDDGLILGAGIKHIGQGFRKIPQAVIHEFTGGVALNTGAFNFTYRGLFNDIIGKTDIAVNAFIKAPDNTINFFGFGNESEYIKENSKSFKNYRTTFTEIKTETMLRNNLSPTSWWSIGPAFEFYDMDYQDNKNRLIGQPPFLGLDSASIYNKKTYISLQGYLSFDTRKDILMPSRGVRWFTSLQAAKGLDYNSTDYFKFQSDLSIYLSFNVPTRFYLSNRTGGGFIIGDFEYFQALTLGNNFNLRGFRNYRFAGRSSLYNNTELRLKLFDFDSYLLPGSFGLIGFFDVGRVWYDDEVSKIWHTGYGGGLYLSPVNRIIITLTYGFSKEDQLPDFNVGFRF